MIQEMVSYSTDSINEPPGGWKSRYGKGDREGRRGERGETEVTRNLFSGRQERSPIYEPMGS